MNKNIEKSHGGSHVKEVVQRVKEINSWLFATKGVCGDDTILMYAALFHDIKADDDRENHHLSGAEEVKKLLANLLDSYDIKRVQNCIREHRASFKGEYSSIEAQILSTADRANPENIEAMFIRSYRYSRERSSNHDEAVENAFKHIKEKYGRGGYAYNPHNRVFFLYYYHQLETLYSKLERIRISDVYDMVEAIKEEYEG